MSATRNIVAHENEQVDYVIIWNALANRLPAEAGRIRDILGQIEADRRRAA